MSRLLALLALLSDAAPAGPQRWDLATFDPPAGTVAQTKDSIGYTAIDQAAHTFCQVSIFNSRPSSGNARADFALEWADTVAAGRRSDVTLTPAAGRTAGGLPFLEGGAMVGEGKDRFFFQVLTFTAGGRRMSVMLSSGDEAGGRTCRASLAGFLASLRLAASASPAPGAPGPAPARPASSDPLVGTWSYGATSGLLYSVTSGMFATYASGDAMSYELKPDGTAEVAGMMESTMGVCTLRIFSRRRGHWSAKGTALVIDYERGDGLSFSSCATPQVKTSRPVLGQDRLQYRLGLKDGKRMLELDGGKGPPARLTFER
jgi:hypothetical protein